MESSNFASFLNKSILRKEFLKNIYYILLYKCSIPHCGPALPTWPHSTPGDRELKLLESTLPEDAYTQVSTFLAKQFF